MTVRNKRNRKKKEKKLTLVPVVIYGIFSQATKKVLAISLSKDDMETELGLGEYDDDCYMAEFQITLFI